MRNCDCIEKMEARLTTEDFLNATSADIQQLELFSGRTYTDFEVRSKEFKKGSRIVPMLHSHCPFCGKPYPKEDKPNE